MTPSRPLRIRHPQARAAAPTPTLPTALVAALVALAILIASMAAQARPAPDSFADLADKLLPAVVNISTTQTVERGLEMPQLPPGSPFEDFFREFFDRNRPQQPHDRKATSLGSGFIIDKAGYVVTNNHVIDGADEISVILQDNTRLDAKLVGHDPKTDLAVLKVETSIPLTAVKFGDSDRSRVGDWVLAIGNPFGLGGTVTAGIISARGRDINSGPYDDFFQTDASINKGNSGGPMFDMDGGVIGINTAIYSPTGGSVGIGFAVPSAVAEPVIAQLIEHGQVQRGWLGVHIQSITDEIAETLGLKETKGALVASVMDGGPADKAGIKAGDVILSFDDKEVSEMRKLPRIVADTPVGKEVKVDLWRGNRKVTVKAAVGRLDDGEAQVATSHSGGGEGGGGNTEQKVAALGLAVSPVNDAVRDRFGLDENAKGVVVVEVDSDGPAAEKGIRPGDLIVEVSQQEVSTPGDVAQRVEDAKKADRRSVLLLLEGQAGLRFVAVRITAD